MQYDFTKIRSAIDESGKTLRDVERATGINNGALSRALRSGRAHPSTALALTKLFRLQMKDVLVKRRKVA
jgi:hypothetical protein